MQGQPQRLAYAELDAWARLMRRRLRPDEVDLLRMIDAIWLTPPKD